MKLASLLEAEIRKRLKYISLSAIYYFVLIAIEILGAMCDEAADLINRLGRRITAVSGNDRLYSFSFSASQYGNLAR
jgi:hypothetical protein